MDKSRELLKKIWGYDNFRPLQEDIVDAAIYGKDVLALLPTGGGKSICFQVPGLAREGICIVISPLIALMEDQVRQLVNRGVRAKALTSGMSYRDMDITLDNARFGGLDFLYVSPERIQTRLFQERLKLMEVGLLVVDEAHCIAEWGHDFRPSYLAISTIREIHPQVPIMAVTATATEKVKQEIAERLQLHRPQVFEASFERSNLTYEVYPVPNKADALLKLCERMTGYVGIIYCQTRRSVKEVMNLLISQKIKANMYHGGMDARQRSMALKDWLSEETPIMVATNAFGMGIDKPNVRFVAHYELPNNPEAYFQEAGRAGRDGHPARTFAFVAPNDLEEIEQRISAQFPPIDQIKLIYRALCNFLKIAIGSGDHETYPLDFSLFTQRFKLDPKVVYPAFKILEMNGNIVFSEHAFHGSRIKITINNAHLYSFQLSNPNVDPLITLICRTHSNVFDEFCEIDEWQFCKRLKISQEALTKQLEYLETHGIIDITWRTSNPLVTFLHERKPDDYLEISPEHYLHRKERAFARLHAMRVFVEREECRQVQLIRYFGQETEPCGKCDVCKRKNVLETPKDLSEQILELFTKPLAQREVLLAFHESLHEAVKETLKQLLIEERIVFNSGRYSLRR
ncbi:MAG TPA: RecQ family ATP-dependent DNA helicase [Fluviicola sp.]|nr:RecQ family ATP-dependent DNA helicase [Fluviicola sp.]